MNSANAVSTWRVEMATNYERPIRDCAGGYIVGDGSFVTLEAAAASGDNWASGNATMRLRMIAEHGVDIRHGREVTV
jgi:hypothetical protein